MKNFDLPPEAREFTVQGKTFHYKDLSPEDVFSDVTPPENGAGPWEISDLQILRFLPEDEHEAWRALRTSKENPVTIKQINDVFSWLWEEATGVPLPQVDLSAIGAGKIDTTSTEKSPSTEETQAASPSAPSRKRRTR